MYFQQSGDNTTHSRYDCVVTVAQLSDTPGGMILVDNRLWQVMKYVYSTIVVFTTRQAMQSVFTSYLFLGHPVADFLPKVREDSGVLVVKPMKSGFWSCISTKLASNKIQAYNKYIISDGVNDQQLHHSANMSSCPSRLGLEQLAIILSWVFNF